MSGGAHPAASAAALEFVADLVRTFGPRVNELLARRAQVQARLDAGERPDFLPETRAVREGDWTVAPLPADLLDRRVEITGPVDRKMIINALNSGASVFMADFEDANSPTWDNLIEGQLNLRDAVRRHDRLRRARDRQEVRARTSRPRRCSCARAAGTCPRSTSSVDGEPVPGVARSTSASTSSTTRRSSLARGTGPYFYLPKMESHLEARLWNDVFVHAQDALGHPARDDQGHGAHRDAPRRVRDGRDPLRAARALGGPELRPLGLHLQLHQEAARTTRRASCPTAARSRWTQPFLRAYSQLLDQDLPPPRRARDGRHGRADPDQERPGGQRAALGKVRADKLREVTDGHDGTWVAHPGLVPIAQGDLRRAHAGPEPARPTSARTSHVTRGRPARACREGTRTEAGLRHNIRVGIQYLEAWLRGSGCVPLYNLMEDAATARSRARRSGSGSTTGATLDDGRRSTAERFAQRRRRRDAARPRRASARSASTRGRFAEARALFEQPVHRADASRSS